MVNKKRLFEVERELREISKHRLDLESEVRALESATLKENEDHYVHKMTIIKDGEFDKAG